MGPAAEHHGTSAPPADEAVALRTCQGDGVTSPPLASLLAASLDWPIVVAAVAVVTAVALWGLFRRGSIADRARSDYADEPDDGSG